MATKKSNDEQPEKKDTLIKIAEKIGEIAGEISVKKDKLTDMASHAVDSIKEGVHSLVEKEKKIVKKLTGKAPKKGAKPAAPKPEMLKKVLHKKTAAEKAASSTVAPKKAAPKKKAATKK